MWAFLLHSVFWFFLKTFLLEEETGKNATFEPLDDGEEKINCWTFRENRKRFKFLSEGIYILTFDL